jgi:hypothetical protein
MENKIVLNHMYSKNLNIYGDLGNIIALQYHAENLGVGLEIVHTEIGTKIFEADIYFVGGGQDRDQMLVYRDLLKRKNFLLDELESDKVFLTVCGGYQLFGNYFLDSQNRMIEGLGLLDFETRALDDKVTSRCIGNIVVEMNEEFIKHWGIDKNFSKYLVGFENHGGQTFLSSGLNVIGNVVRGFGNNTKEKKEGCWYKNFIGCYMHGSLLPKNPHLARTLILKALSFRYSGKPNVHPGSDSGFGQNDGLTHLDLELQAHKAILLKSNLS